MLKKLRWRFILSAMIATFTVLLVLIVSINLITYSLSTRHLDSVLEAISQFKGEAPGPFDMERFAKSGLLGDSPAQIQSAAAFFQVTFDGDGTTTKIDNDAVSSITDAEALEYANAALQRGNTYDYYHEYRYYIEETDEKTVVTFLNASANVRQTNALFMTSIIVALVSLLAVFALTVLLSKRAIAPYIKNIEMQKQFITNASHEIKTPLTAIATSADVLALDRQGDEWVENIQSQTVRLSKLVTNLVTLSRLNEEVPFPNKSEFSLSDALWETAEPFATLTKGKEKTLTQEISGGLKTTGDRAAIQQMVSILLDNAVKYSSANSTIHLSASKKGKRVQIEVSNACDIKDVRDLDRLFDRFYRPDKSRTANTGGSGIGLAIAKATAENHGGSISVNSADGKTITFRVVL